MRAAFGGKPGLLPADGEYAPSSPNKAGWQGIVPVGNRRGQTGCENYPEIEGEAGAMTAYQQAAQGIAVFRRMTFTL